MKVRPLSKTSTRMLLGFCQVCNERVQPRLLGSPWCSACSLPMMSDVSQVSYSKLLQVNLQALQGCLLPFTDKYCL